MISNIQGKVKKKNYSSVLVDVSGLCYEVMIPPAIMKSIERDIKEDSTVNLVTYHYYQVEPSRSIPVLIGFANEVEREFFELFITVSGVGPKAACRALSVPFSAIADAIDKSDVKFLKTLPGIGEQRAREIIAKLQGKVGKFGLIQDRFLGELAHVDEDIKQEALDVLLQLQYKNREAREMIDKAISRNSKVSSCEEILNEVYKQRKTK